MGALLAKYFEQLTNADYLFAITSLHVALLGSTLIFIGFVQVAISSTFNDTENNLAKQVSKLVSKNIIRRVRLVVLTTTSGALSGWASYITGNAIIATIASILFLIALIVVGILSYNITHEFLFLNADILDGDKENR